jgi:AcrR family transcriptional regulator
VGAVAGRRDQVLDAALQVLGAEGSRGLTHRAVDRAAGVALGTTSNHFRTRQALLQGVVERLVAAESAVFSQLGLPDGAIGDTDLARAGAAMLGFLLGPGRPVALARHALFLEAAQRPDVREALRPGAETWWSAVAALLARAGCPEPGRRARILLACVDGLLVDQLARPDPAFDAEAALLAVLRGVLAHDAL